MEERFPENDGFDLYEEEMPVKDRSRGDRRKKDYTKAKRKMELSKTWLENGWYGECLHRYSKNKIHCSCPLCVAKTRGKFHKGGAVSENELKQAGTGRHLSLVPMHWGVTNHRYGTRYYTVSDMKKIDSLALSVREYTKEAR